MSMVTTGEMTTQDLAKMRHLHDRQEIYDCLIQVGRGADRFDRELFVGAFHPDAMIEAGGEVGAPADVYEGGRAMHEAAAAATLHCHSSHTCEIDGDQAHAETYYIYN